MSTETIQLLVSVKISYDTPEGRAYVIRQTAKCIHLGISGWHAKNGSYSAKDIGAKLHTGPAACTKDHP